MKTNTFIIKTFSLALIFCLIAACVSTSEQSIKSSNCDGVVPFTIERGLTYPDPDFCVVYKTTAQRELKGYVFEANSEVVGQRAPAIIFIHGGGWKKGSPKQFFDQARFFADLGITSVSIEYRLTREDNITPKDSLADAKSAMRWIKEHAKSLNIDENRIIAAGGSAGGQLAAALATVDGFNDPADNLDISTKPFALILYDPVVDNSTKGWGYHRVAEYWEEFSPTHNVKLGHPPTQILLGTEDNLVPVSVGERYCSLVQEVSQTCDLMLYEGSKHGFYNRHFKAGESGEMLAQTNQDVRDFLIKIGILS